MRVIAGRFCRRALYSVAGGNSTYFSSSLSAISRALHTCSQSHPQPPFTSRKSFLAAAPWSALQLRGAKFRGSDVRPGNVIERKGKVYQVIKAQHTTQGRGGAIIQVELRDIDSGNKVNERLRTDEAVEKIYVEEKSLTYLYTDHETKNVVLMDPKTFEQLDVPEHLFGEAVFYLKENMTVNVQLFDERPMSASVPQRVTCTVTEAQVPVKGTAATPHYKKVQLDNGLSVQVPAHILTGDKIIINTTDNSYMSRA